MPSNTARSPSEHSKPGTLVEAAGEAPNDRLNGRALNGQGFNGSLDNLDAEVRARLAKLVGGMSPVHVTESVLDWGMHLAMSPGKQIRLFQSAFSKAGQLANFAAQAMAGGTPEAVAELPAPMTPASNTKAGRAGRSTSCHRASCSPGNGPRRPPRALMVSPRTMRRPWHSLPISFSMRCRPTTCR